MKISIDERDLIGWQSVELYIKERQYLLNQQEYNIVKKICENLGATSEYHLGICDFKEKDLVDGIAVFIFEREREDDFHCWSNIKKKDEEEKRRRQIHLEITDVENAYLLKSYVNERNYLLNSKEYLLVQQKAMNMKIKKRTFQPMHIKEGIYQMDLKNQIEGCCTYQVENEEIFFHVMSYHPYARERKKGI